MGSFLRGRYSTFCVCALARASQGEGTTRVPSFKVWRGGAWKSHERIQDAVPSGVTNSMVHFGVLTMDSPMSVNSLGVGLGSTCEKKSQDIQVDDSE